MLTGEGVDVRLVVPTGPPPATHTSNPVPAPASPRASPLPRTGVDLLTLLLLAVVLLTLGALLVRRTPTRRS